MFGRVAKWAYTTTMSENEQWSSERDRSETELPRAVDVLTSAIRLHDIQLASSLSLSDAEA